MYRGVHRILSDGILIFPGRHAVIFLELLRKTGIVPEAHAVGHHGDGQFPVPELVAVYSIRFGCKTQRHNSFTIHQRPEDRTGEADSGHPLRHGGRLKRAPVLFLPRLFHPHFPQIYRHDPGGLAATEDKS